MDVKQLPTRLGYVIRCSNTEAIHKNDKTYILDNNSLIELIEPCDEEVKRLKELYWKIQSMIDNYCEHEHKQYYERVNIYECNKCQMVVL